MDSKDIPQNFPYHVPPEAVPMFKSSYFFVYDTGGDLKQYRVYKRSPDDMVWTKVMFVSYKKHTSMTDKIGFATILHAILVLNDAVARGEESLV